MNAFKVARTIAAVICGLLLSLGSARSASDIRDLAKDEFEVPEFRDRLASVVELLRIGDYIHVGPGLDGSKVNIKVVKESAILYSSMPSLSMNAMAVKPNIILISELLASTLTLDAMNSSLAYTYENANRSGDALTDSITDLKIFSIRRLTLLRELRRGYVPDGEDVTKEVKDLLRAAGALHDEHIDFVFAGAFSQLLFHELAHLKTIEVPVAETSGLFDSLLDFLDRRLAQSTFDEEVRADTVAAIDVGNTYLYIKKNNSLNAKLFAEGMESYLFLMKDIVFNHLLVGERGLNAEDFVIKMLHASCRNNSAFADLDYTNPDRVAVGAETHLPVLTRSEYEGLAKRLRGANVYLTHPHNFERAVRLLQVMTDKFEFRGHFNVREGTDLLNTLNDPSISFRREPATQADLPWNSNDILRALSGFYGMEEGKLCPGTECWVGFPIDKELKGFVEVIEDYGRLKSIRFALPVGAKFGSVEYYRQIALSVTVFANIFQLSTEEITAIGNARIDYLQCGIGSYILNGDGFTVFADSTIEGGYIFYDIVPIDKGRSFLDNWRGPY
ncbi:hypothetical protein [Mesorhizobium sp. B263B2A]|uniref:hypothetical protein n=1 Tax=Mesorhizobium sp. B263B2A TaxID=2876669 RepID=UPI001CD0ABB2|nr:hypothetical protein [Mesorhizobium sp. B263B2A]MCA0031782.1 hypothetical protein [Mesorhizobium sp. B263B2A]